MAKVCSFCNVSKELEDFARSYRSKDGRATSCKECRKIKYREIKFCKDCGKEREFNARTGYCTACKSKYDAERKARLKIEYKELISSLGCSCCGFSHPDALEVHHLSKESKRFGVAQSQGNAYNREDLESGVAIVLCANCHLIFHSYFGGRGADFPPQTLESTVEIINNSRRVKS